MRFFLLALLVVGFSLTCVAEESTVVDLSKLTPEQRAAIQQQVQALGPKTGAAEVREELNEWSKVGANIGVAMVAAAKELGVAAGEFAKTPLGMTIVVVLIFKILGVTIFGLLFGAALGIVTWKVWGRYNDMYLHRPVYEYKPYLWGFWNRRVIVSYVDNKVSDEGKHLGAISLCVLTIATIVVLAVTIAHM